MSESESPPAPIKRGSIKKIDDNAFHGGAFFDAIGTKFDDLSKSDEIINADVLDAWFDPSPSVIDALKEKLEWISKTSPPTHSEGLMSTISQCRNIPLENIVVGSGSSSLMFIALRELLSSESKVLILDPTYGEYPHLLNNVIKCKTKSLRLRRDENYKIDISTIKDELEYGYDALILVNPNSPTGQHIESKDIEDLINNISDNILVWIDETYTDFVSPLQTCEKIAPNSKNVIICKSMSKAYGLSGLRVAYLSGATSLISRLSKIVPPWSVSLPGQIAGVFALKSWDYYQEKYKETKINRTQFQTDLENIGIEVIPGSANFLLCHTDSVRIPSSELVKKSKEFGLYIRDISLTSSFLGEYAVRIAVKSGQENSRIIEILKRSLDIL